MDEDRANEGINPELDLNPELPIEPPPPTEPEPEPEPEPDPPQRPGIILPVEETTEENDILKDFQELLETGETHANMAYIQDLFKSPENIPEAMDLETKILLNLLIAGHIGTASQRGSITRILNTLRDRYIANPNPKLVNGLNKVLEQRLL